MHNYAFTLFSQSTYSGGMDFDSVHLPRHWNSVKNPESFPFPRDHITVHSSGWNLRPYVENVTREVPFKPCYSAPHPRYPQHLSWRTMKSLELKKNVCLPRSVRRKVRAAFLPCGGEVHGRKDLLLHLVGFLFNPSCPEHKPASVAKSTSPGF